MVRLIPRLVKKEQKPATTEQALVQDIRDEEAGKVSGGVCFPVPWPPYYICW